MARTSRPTAGTVAAAVTVGLVLALGGCGGGDDDGNDGGEASPTAEPTPTGSTSLSSTPTPLPSPTGTVRGASRVGLRSSGGLGKILAGPDGRTLYLFASDTEESTCYDACAEAWPPLIAAGKPKAGKGVDAGLLGTTKRSDGSLQVTYSGHPLYSYADDDEPGEADGQGLDQFGARWWVLDASGNKVDDQADDGQDQERQEDQDQEQDPDQEPERGY